MNVHYEVIIKLGMKIRFKCTSSYEEQGVKYFSNNIFKDKYCKRIIFSVYDIWRTMNFLLFCVDFIGG